MQKDIDVDAMVTNAQSAAKWLKAIANPYRLMILCQLLDNELSVTQLNENVPLSQSALSITPCRSRSAATRENALPLGMVNSRPSSGTSTGVAMKER